MDRIASVVTKLIQEHEAEFPDSWVSTEIGVGAPGRFHNGALLPSEFPGMGLKYDGYDFARGLIAKLNAHWSARPRNWKILADNDGARQRDYGIYQAASNPYIREQIKGEKVAYIGPGTGLGGGFAEISDSPDAPPVKRFYTDGHIESLRLIGLPNSPFADRMSGNYVQRTLGISALELSQNIPQYLPFIEDMGNHLGELMEALYFGAVTREHDWSYQDTRDVAGTSVFIIGGSIGTRGEMAQIILRKAREYLDNHALRRLMIIPIQGDSADAGIIGASLPALQADP